MNKLSDMFSYEQSTPYDIKMGMRSLEEEAPELSEEEAAKEQQEAEHSGYMKYFYQSMFALTSLNINRMALHSDK